MVGGLLLLAISVGILAGQPVPGDPDLRWAVAGSWAGLAAGWRTLERRRKRSLILTSVLGSAFLTAAAAPGPQGPAAAFVGMTIAWSVLWGPSLALFLAGMGVGGRRASGDPALEPSSGPAMLRDDEQRIAARLGEIGEQRQRVDTVSALLEKERQAAALGPVREKVQYARTVLDEQEARYRARLWAIDLVRWRGRLGPAALAADGVHGFADAAARLEQLATVTEEGEAMLRRWTRVHDVAATPEGARCIGLLRTLLARGDEIRQQLIVQKAMLAIRGIAPVDDAVEAAGLADPAAGAADAAPGGGLADAMAELDAEYQRLRDDHEIAREVDRALRELMPPGDAAPPPPGGIRRRR